MKVNVFLKKMLPNTILFISGSGSNAEMLLKSRDYGKKWKCSAVFTDRPETSGARSIAQAYDLPFLELDIHRFYHEHGLKTTSLAAAEGKRVRECWTNEIRRLIAPYHPDLLLFAGFFSLCNIASDYCCLNIHPGDLTHEVNGRRDYIGLNRIPIEKAILAGEKFLRSSVLVVQPGGVDSGPLPGISEQVPVLLEEHSLEELRKIAAERGPGKKPDLLSRIADYNQVNLKEHGDWLLFPSVVSAFAEGRYALDENGSLLWRMDDGEWLPVSTIEFTSSGPHPLPRKG